MTEFLNLGEVLNRMSGGNSGNPETLFYNKATDRALGGGTSVSRESTRPYSLWCTDGSPGFGAVPGTTAVVPTSATAGAIPFANASGGREKRIVCATMFGSGGYETNMDIHLYDRLLHVGGLNATLTSAQDVQNGAGAGVSLTRYTNGVGNQIWLEIYTTVGPTARTVTCSYTNQAGTSGRTTQAHVIGASSTSGGAYVAFEVVRMQLQAGDTGVQSVQTVTLSGSTATAGSFGITIGHPICTIGLYNNVGVYDFTRGDSGTFVLQDNACLATILRSSTGESHIAGMIATAER